MADVKILMNNGEPVSFRQSELDSVKQVSAEAARWAEANGFHKLTFWLEAADSRKLFVQIGDEPVLTSWVDAGVFREGRIYDLEGQLDFVRGEYRRRAAGIDKFDR